MHCTRYLWLVVYATGSEQYFEESAVWLILYVTRNKRVFSLKKGKGCMVHTVRNTYPRECLVETLRHAAGNSFFTITASWVSRSGSRQKYCASRRS